jgi:hypothetical protein
MHLIPDDELDLDWFSRPRNPADPDPDGYDQVKHGRLPKSIWTTVAPWFSNTPEDPDRLAEKPPPNEILAKRSEDLRDSAIIKSPLKRASLLR